MPFTSALIAGMDILSAFACVLFVILGQPQTEIDQQIVRKQEELALLDEAVEKRREERQASRPRRNKSRMRPGSRLAGGGRSSGAGRATRSRDRVHA